MNRYPLWKYLLIAFTIVVAAVYSLPNLFGETPAVQVSTNRQAIVINDQTQSKVDAALKQAGIQTDGMFIVDNSLKVRFKDTETQLKARDVIENTLGEGYITALNLLADSPEWMAKIKANPMFLGLDLRGGVHFTMQVDMKAAMQKTFERYSGDIRREMRREKIRTGTIRQIENGLIVPMQDAADVQKAMPKLRQLFPEANLNADGNNITLLATDRYRLAMRELKWDSVSDMSEAALVKARILQDVAKSMTSGAKVEIGLSQESQPGASSLIGFQAGGRRTTSTLMDGDYPPVRRLFPETTTIQAIVERHTLLEAVKRVSLVAERKTSVRLSFSDGQLVLEAGQGDNAQASEVVQAQLMGDDIATAFNPQYLSEGLSVMDTEYVRFGFTHPTKPAVITGQEKADGGESTDFRYLLMPIRYGI